MVIRLASLAAVLACALAAQAAPPDPPPLVPSGGPAMAAPLSKEHVKAQQVRIEEQYDQSQARCRRLQGPARELCNEEARGERDIQAAELEMRARPSAENDEKLRLARAEASYSKAMVKCKTLEGTAKGVCRKDAKTVFEAARVEASLQKDVVAATLRSEQTVRERTIAADRVAQAQFKAARERCEMLPGEGRENCLADAKKRFGQL